MAIIVLLYIGSIIIILWGIGHLFPTKGIIQGFGELSDDNRKIITMEWIAEGLAIIFLGLLPLLMIIFGNSVEKSFLIAILCSASMLVVLAILSTFTGARSSILPMKLCPFIKSTGALLLILGAVLGS